MAKPELSKLVPGKSATVCSAKPQYKLIRDFLFGESYDKFSDKGTA